MSWLLPIVLALLLLLVLLIGMSNAYHLIAATFWFLLVLPIYGGQWLYYRVRLWHENKYAYDNETAVYWNQNHEITAEQINDLRDALGISVGDDGFITLDYEFCPTCSDTGCPCQQWRDWESMDSDLCDCGCSECGLKPEAVTD